MYCQYCGKEIPENSEFCGYCGKKINENIKNKATEQEESKDEKIKQDEKKAIKISLKMLIIIICVIIALIAIIGAGIISNKSRNEISGNTQENVNKSIYELNRVGFYKNNNILEEKYNDNGDLIYCKYKLGDTIKEDRYSYKYDTKGNVIEMFLNTQDGQSTLNIEYEENNISKITTNYELMKNEYYFIYELDKIVVKEYVTTNKTLAGQTPQNEEYKGAFIIHSKEINGKNYRFIIELDKENNIVRQKIYESDETKVNNTFELLSMMPIQYIDKIKGNKTSNFITSYPGLTITLPIIKQGNEIYSTNTLDDTTSYSWNFYDKEGRILYNKYVVNEETTNKWYFKYEKIDDKSYLGYCIVDAGSEDFCIVLGMNSRYMTGKIRYYLDDNNDIYKYEIFKEEYISEEKFKELEKGYLEYIDNNKIDSNRILKEFAEYMNNKNAEQSNNNQEENSKDEIQENNSSQNTNNEQNTTNNNNKQETINNNDSNNQETNNNEKEEINTTISIDKVNDTSTTENYNLKVFVEVETNGEWYKEVNKLTATVNGTTMTKNISGETISFSSNVKLSKGTNNLKVTVTNGEGITENETCIITYNVPKPQISTYNLGDRIEIEVKNDNGSSPTENTKVTVNGNVLKRDGYSSTSNTYVYYIKEEDTILNIVATNQYGESVSKAIDVK